MKMPQQQTQTELTATTDNQIMARFIGYIDRGEKTTKTYLTNLKQFMAWMHFKGISEPTRDDILLYRQWLLSDHEAIRFDSVSGYTFRTDATGATTRISCKPNTVKQYLQSVRQFFKWLESEGLYNDIASNIHLPKTNNATHKKDSLAPSEVLEIERCIIDTSIAKVEGSMDAIKDRDGRIQRAEEQGKRLKAMYLLAVNAGLRTIELSRANIKDIEIKGGQAFLYIHGKGRSEPDQKKPLAPEVHSAIKDYLDIRADATVLSGNSPLFVSTGNRSAGKRIATTTISTMLKNAMKQAGYDSERLTAHSLRHTAGQNVMEVTGGNIYKTQMYMRHSDPKTTEIYLDNDTAEQDQHIAQLLYDRYHGYKTDDYDSAVKEEILTLMATMDGKQLKKLLKSAKEII